MKYLKNNLLEVTIIGYLIISFFLKIKEPILYINLINPLFWSIILIYLMLKRKNCYISLPLNEKYFFSIIIISIIYIILYFHLGFVFGFAKSPYNHHILKVLSNIFKKIIPIIGLEIVRCKFIFKSKKTSLNLFFITLLFILLEIDFSILIYLYPYKELFFKYLCSTITLLIASNILYTYLSLKGSYQIPLTFRIIEQINILLLPIIPNLDWFINGSIGLIKVTLIYLIFKYKVIKEKKNILKKSKTLYIKLSYALTLLFIIFFISFMFGKFKYEPIAIISNSMFPVFSRGDVLIYEKKNSEELKNLKPNTIIVYRIGNQNIAHRIIAKTTSKNEVLYTTKGDNNNAPDINKVKVEQILGVYKLHTKYLGFPSVWLNDYFNKSKEKTETK